MIRTDKTFSIQEYFRDIHDALTNSDFHKLISQIPELDICSVENDFRRILRLEEGADTEAALDVARTRLYNRPVQYNAAEAKLDHACSSLIVFFQTTGVDVALIHSSRAPLYLALACRHLEEQARLHTWQFANWAIESRKSEDYDIFLHASLMLIALSNFQNDVADRKRVINDIIKGALRSGLGSCTSDDNGIELWRSLGEEAFNKDLESVSSEIKDAIRMLA